MILLFGDRLKELRKKNNLTQVDIAEMFNVTFSTVSAWEVGKAQPNYEILTKLADYFNVTTDYLLGFNQEDRDNIERLNIALREAGMVNSDETLKEEEIKFAIDQARQYKIMMTKILDMPTKYQEVHHIIPKADNEKDTNN